jgi:hypothetical protein
MRTQLNCIPCCDERQQASSDLHGWLNKFLQLNMSFDVELCVGRHARGHSMKSNKLAAAFTLKSTSTFHFLEPILDPVIKAPDIHVKYSIDTIEQQSFSSDLLHLPLLESVGRRKVYDRTREREQNPPLTNRLHKFSL